MPCSMQGRLSYDRLEPFMAKVQHLHSLPEGGSPNSGSATAEVSQASAPLLQVSCVC